MNHITPDNLLENLNWRYATKEFDSTKKIDTKTWAALEESLLLTPSSFGLQPWKFISITNQSVKESLVEHSWGQKQVSDCSHMLVLCVKDNMSTDDTNSFLDKTAEVRGIPRESLDGYAGMMAGFFGSMDDAQTYVWAKNQVYIALGQLMTSAAVLGIDACPMEGILPAEYDRILKLDGTGYSTAVACPLGYRSANDKYASLAKVRFDSNQIIESIN